MADEAHPADGRHDDELIFPNGVDGATGRYLLPPLAPKQVAALARGESLDALHIEELKLAHEQATQGTFGPRAGIDPKNLAETGWAVLFAHDADPAIREALAERLTDRGIGVVREQDRPAGLGQVLRVDAGPRPEGALSGVLVGKLELRDVEGVERLATSERRDLVRLERRQQVLAGRRVNPIGEDQVAVGATVGQLNVVAHPAISPTAPAGWRSSLPNQR